MRQLEKGLLTLSFVVDFEKNDILLNFYCMFLWPELKYLIEIDTAGPNYVVERVCPLVGQKEDEFRYQKNKR